MGDVAVEFAVLLDVGIEEIEGDAAHISFPNGGVNDVVGERHINDDLVSVCIKHTLNRQHIEFLCFIVSYLLAVHRELLGEVTVAV